MQTMVSYKACQAKRKSVLSPETLRDELPHERRSQAPQDASTSPANLFKSAYHIVSKLFCNEGYLDN